MRGERHYSDSELQELVEQELDAQAISIGDLADEIGVAARVLGEVLRGAFITQRGLISSDDIEKVDGWFARREEAQDRLPDEVRARIHEQETPPDPARTFSDEELTGFVQEMLAAPGRPSVKRLAGQMELARRVLYAVAKPGWQTGRGLLTTREVARLEAYFFAQGKRPVLPVTMQLGSGPPQIATASAGWPGGLWEAKCDGSLCTFRETAYKFQIDRAAKRHEKEWLGHYVRTRALTTEEMNRITRGEV